MISMLYLLTCLVINACWKRRYHVIASRRPVELCHVFRLIYVTILLCMIWNRNNISGHCCTFIALHSNIAHYYKRIKL